MTVDLILDGCGDSLEFVGSERIVPGCRFEVVDDGLDVGDLEVIDEVVPLDVRKRFGELTCAVFQCELSHHRFIFPEVRGKLQQFTQMSEPVGSSVEGSGRFQDTTDFADCAERIRDVIEHVVRDHDVERLVTEWQRLRIGDE